MNFLRVLLLMLFSALVAGGVVFVAQGDKESVETSATGLPTVGDFALLDHNGRFHRLYDYRHAKAVVLFSHGVGCPIVRNSIPSLQQLRRNYADKGVEFLLINANPQDDRDALTKEAALIGVDMPILKDDAQLVAEALDMARTGEAVLLDTANWAVRYRGPIDDRLDYETQKPKATQRYLEDAIQAVVDDAPVEAARIPAVGCAITKRETGADKDATISYTQDVAPILREKCLACHRPGGVGPWVMDGYQTVKGWSAMIREVIMNKRMPPWHADPLIGELDAARSLSVEEQRTLVHWIDAGAPRGAGDDPLVQQPPGAMAEWPMGEPDLVIDLPEQKLPAQGVLPYRWIKVPAPVEADTWVRAVDLKPSNGAVMHHGFVLVEYPKNLKNKQPAWLEGLNGFFAAYVPGVNVMPFPEDSGQLLPAGATLVFQLHYVTVGYPTADKPRLGLYFHRQPPAKEYKMVSASNMAIRIPPFVREHEEKAATVLKEDALLHGFYPHMHYRGSRFEYEAQYPDGSREKLLSVPNYDINWQTFYRLKQPKLLPAGTKILVNAAFDNSEFNPANPDPSKEVRWGLKSSDEMLVGYVMYTPE